MKIIQQFKISWWVPFFFNKGVVSPYIYSGTNLYKKGKFVSDGSYNASVTDKQPGVYILIKKII